MSTAFVTLVAAREAGLSLAAENGALRCRPAPSPELLERLRASKNELLQVLTGAHCRRCGERMAWLQPVGVVYADGTAEHHECRIWAAARRAVESPDALADPAEVMLRGEIA
jgi:hypothetical protein